MPKLSIITVTWNAVQELPPTLESVFALAQQDYELIIIDGASTDGTVEYVQSLGNRVHQFVSEKDAGIYDAMNKGLHMARGEYVWFLNAGDTAYNAHVADLIFEDSDPADVYYGDTLMETPEGKVLGLRRGSVPEYLRLKHLRTGMKVSHQSLIVRRSVAPDYDLRYRYVADLDWLIRLLKSGARVKNMHCVVSVFKTGGTSGRNWRKAMWERWDCLRRHFGTLGAFSAHVRIGLRAPLAHVLYRH